MCATGSPPLVFLDVLDMENQFRDPYYVSCVYECYIFGTHDGRTSRKSSGEIGRHILFCIAIQYLCLYSHTV
jgi:hypothetical protein